MNKYEAINNNYFGFEIFEEIFKVMNEQRHPEHDMFNAGIASADAAIRRLREKHYESIKKIYDQENEISIS